MNFVYGFVFISLINGIYSSGRVKKDCVCGEANIKNSGRIVNGRQTTPHKYPWVAGMFSPESFMCGGAIISDRNILTAGHCLFYNKEPFLSYWVLGMHDQRIKDGITYGMEHYMLHPKFFNYTIYDDYDMAIVTVKGRIKFNQHISPICLTQPQLTYVGKSATVSENAPMGAVLQETRVRIKTPGECFVEVARLVKYDDKSMLCAKEKFTDACNGDSGGPLFLETDPNRYELIAVVSFGDGCARSFPGIYGKVGTYDTLGWISRYIRHSHGDLCSDPAKKITQVVFNSL